jgi:hypothetical protein
MSVPESRIFIKVPVAVIERMNEGGLTANKQVGKILETFWWDTLEFKFELDFSKHEFKRIQVYLSEQAKQKLKTYCLRNKKTTTVAVTQALIVLGKYHI